MRITLRTNQDDWFISKVEDKNYAVSMTANFEGFTPSNAMIRAYKWDEKEIIRSAESCNSMQEVMIFDYFSPVLLLVPKTRGDANTEALMKSLIEATNYINAEHLHFRHYSSLHRELQATKEVTDIFNYFFNPNLETSLKEILFDVGDKKIIEIYNKVTESFNLK
jgi:hypothetical protein